MRPLLINTQDISGGAAIAAYRLHNGLLSIGIPSLIYVQKKIGTDPTIISSHQVFGKIYSTIRSRFDRSPTFFYRNRDPALWSPAWLPNLAIKKIARINPDIVHLHWICGGFLPIPEIQKILKPIIWTFHDMWPMTGGCHYTGDCEKYQCHCGACPFLGSQSNNDLSAWVWKRKMRYWKDLDLTIVTPSNWLAQCAKKSALFHKQSIEVIPNCLNTSQFAPVDKTIARTRLSLPLNKNLILFGAINATTDKRKGFSLLKESLKNLSDDCDYRNTDIVLFGNLDEAEKCEIKMEIHSLGRIPDDATLSFVYSAADVFIAPSLQENLSNTVMESLACGTPVVAFNIGGMPDMIDHKRNGYLAKPFECQDLAEGIVWVLEDDEKCLQLSESARKKVLENYESTNIAHRYLNLYEKIAGNNNSEFDIIKN